MVLKVLALQLAAWVLESLSLELFSLDLVGTEVVDVLWVEIAQAWQIPPAPDLDPAGEVQVSLQRYSEQVC